MADDRGLGIQRIFTIRRLALGFFSIPKFVDSRYHPQRTAMDPRIKTTILIAFSAGAGVAVVIAALPGGAYLSTSDISDLGE